jgi:hypothetical protein
MTTRTARIELLQAIKKLEKLRETFEANGINPETLDDGIEKLYEFLDYTAEENVFS